ncbi:endoplasmic reticulum-Golgi intermediate compartment protein 3 [Pelomyxa schiedti]|nr:endoplasmic reticulum-Golgi intermediate compartment protein 3 [Pelomyxa schiedti]
MLDRLRQFDAYPKYDEESGGFRVRTSTGALLSVVCLLLIGALVAEQVQEYRKIQVLPEIKVDTSRKEKITLNFDITFPHLSCNVLGVDTMDSTGAQQIDISHNVFKQRLDKQGKPLDVSYKADIGSSPQAEAPPPVPQCGSCYGAADDTKKCCTCTEVQQLYRQRGWRFDPNGVAQCRDVDLAEKIKAQPDEGCRLYGFVRLKKIAGNMHIAPGTSFQDSHTHMHGASAELGKVNNTHIIHSLSFGDDFPGILHPLDDTYNIDEHYMGMIQYFIKVVPTEYEEISGNIVTTNQYSVTAHTKYVDTPDKGLPGVYFMYDLSPLVIKYVEGRSFTLEHFVTGVCAIVGGVFTALALLDSLMFRALKLSSKRD